MKLRCVLLVGAIALSQLQVVNSHAVTKDIIINVVGDVHGESAIDRKAIPALKQNFADGDLNIFNLETAITDHTIKEEKEFNFKADLAFLKTLKRVGFNVASIANNHSYDYGAKGFADTLQNLRSAGITYVGGGVNNKSAYHGRVYTIRGVRIGILGFAKVNGGPASIAKKDKPGITDGYDAQSTEEAITHLRKLSDVLIILTHWGEEGSFCTRNYEVSSAKKWISLGADAIVGSHTHTVQPISYVDKKLVAYSLGNFIFYSSHIENRSTGIMKLRINAKRKVSYTFEPMVINNLTKVPEKVGAAGVPVFNCENQAKTTVR